MRRSVLVAACLVIVFFSAAGSAAVTGRIFAAENPSLQNVETRLRVDLGTNLRGNPVGKTLSFRVQERTSVVAFFNAECSVIDEPGDWLEIDILVDGTRITGDDNVFCMRGAERTFGSASIQGARVVDPGRHTVRVLARFRGDGPGATLDDASLIVMTEPR